MCVQTNNNPVRGTIVINVSLTDYRINEWNEREALVLDLFTLRSTPRAQVLEVRTGTSTINSSGTSTSCSGRDELIVYKIVLLLCVPVGMS